jgi:hypothetical protein
MVVAAITPSLSGLALDAGDIRVEGAGSTVSCPITLDAAPTGLSGYNITVTVENPAVAEILDVSYPEWAGIHGNSTLPSSSVWMKAADLNDIVQSSTQPVSLGTVVIRGLSAGSSSIRLTTTAMDDDGGNVLAPASGTGTITVETGTGPGELSAGQPAAGSPAAGGSIDGSFDLIAQIIAFIKGLLGMQ